MSSPLKNARRSRLDRLLCTELGLRRPAVQLMLAQRRIKVDGEPVMDGERVINGFNTITVDDRSVLAQQAVYVMLHKPRGVLSATSDDKHRVATSLIQHPAISELHIAGRLDLHSSGLLLLTNDGAWSRQLSAPDNAVTKVYEVTVEKPLTDEYVTAFTQGMHFGFENITTRPARLEILGEHQARVSLQEGRYHQIKRMFGRFRNPVLSIHRVAIGGLVLDESLEPGKWRELNREEAARAVLNSTQEFIDPVDQ